MQVGKYQGVPIDQLPASYCRWLLSQDFPVEILEIAKAKVDASPTYSEPLAVSRHALDRFSLRFLHKWFEYKGTMRTGYDGMATFLVKLATEAWEQGKDVSKNRHQDDGIVKQHKGILFVFNQSKQFPEYKELITVMERTKHIPSVPLDNGT